ncbi:ribonuclease H [Dendrothele bispora CBS 962.96]|uniref:Ribonuclease H n=1 Tax=Dendrothele bispora (strain CBS 962.96) TaxID=1314807 RepID=A0A4S8L4L7_DENBC|nr:ribonuclease H [Dendrothele bispora CBS 962.96]
MKRTQNSSSPKAEGPKKKAKVIEAVSESFQEITVGKTTPADGEWTKVEKKKKKEKKTKLKMETTQPRFMYSNSDIARRHHAIGIEEIRDLALHIIADSPPPNWLRVDNAALIPKVVTLLIPGLTSDVLSLPPLPTSATANPNLPISIPLPPRDVPGNAQTGIPFIASTFSHACPTRAPGDQTRMHSILSTFFSCPITNAEKQRRMQQQQQQNGRERDQDPSQYVLSVEQMIENEYPVPSYMSSVFEKTPGWVETPEQPEESLLTPSEGKPKPKVYGIDCEMCLTEDGKELTRVCVVDFHTGKVVYDTLVKPAKPILDYLTRWSGITAAALSTATTTFSEAQAHILKLLTPTPPPPNPFSTSQQTPLAPPTPILLGHSLESDLKALKICHPFCIDTALLYHHPRGRPLKPGLAWLTKKWCNREIQTRGEGGHDPEEDARACLELLQKKLVEGPGFGEFKTDYESIFERIGRAPKRSGGGPGSIRTAVVDRGNPGLMHGNKATKSVGCEDDEEAVNQIVDLLPSHDFVFGRLMGLANLKGWTTPKQSPDAPLPPPTPPPTQEELEAVLAQLNTQLKTIYSALPSSTALIIFTGHSDPRTMVALNGRKNAFETAIRSGKPIDKLEKEEQWRAGDVRALEEAVELTKRGLLFLGIKA